MIYNEVQKGVKYKISHYEVERLRSYLLIMRHYASDLSLKGKVFLIKRFIKRNIASLEDHLKLD